MNRRQLLGTMGLTATALLVKPLKALGEEADVADLTVQAVVSANHGHALTVSLSDLIRMLQQANITGPVSVSIEGTATHAHNLVFKVSDLVSLLINGKLAALASSEASGHSHQVQVSLVG